MKNVQISQAIVAHIAAGKTLPEAYDAVFGAGAYVKLAGQIYDELRAA